MNDSISALLARLRAELFADKKKSAILGVLFFVLLVAVGRMLLTKSGPEQAVAHGLLPLTPEPIQPAGAAANPTAPRIRPVSEGSSPGPVSPSPEPTPVLLPPPAMTSATAQDAPIPDKVAHVDSAPQRVARDLFASPAWTSFGRGRSGTTSRPADSADDAGDFWSQFVGSIAEQQARNRRDFTKIESDARAFHLNATMSGPHPSAYISGRLVHVGDTIGSFSVVSIEDGAVTLERDGHRVVLRIQ